MKAPKGYKPPVPAREVDPLLEFWVRMANRTGTETGVTVHVGGSIIRGTCIPMDQWLDRMASGVREARSNNPEIPRLFAEHMQFIRDKVKATMDEEAEAEQIDLDLRLAEAEEIGADPNSVTVPEPDLYRYMHLKDVTVQQGSITYTLDAYRIDLRTVDGWTLGS